MSSKQQNSGGELLPLLALTVIAAMAGFFVGARFTLLILERQAIERGYAEHDAVTGNWKWKENEATDGH